jgi:hypothetical protein
LNKRANQSKLGDVQLPWDIEIYKIVTEHFRQDVREYWTRANFYLLAQTGLFSVFTLSFTDLIRYQAVVAISVTVLGLLVAIIWFMVLRGSIKWLQRWREQVCELDKELDKFLCYYKVEIYAKEKPYWSPSYVTQFLPLVFTIVWLIMLLFSLSFL